ncbi:Cof-type HAD-IIB family hydrolase [Hominifimenecus sp. rT4P-3]|uniref:Cof-type HAD-IIB family hydrolase n=1 Tax=Hominifimenecus sp. rT4P-3 TaxID=3242979 RepID=UPI003DA51D16
MIRLIALDLDGTTLRSDGTLSDRTKKALKEAIKRGVHVVVASGRSFHSLPLCLREIQGLEYAISSNGAAISRMLDGTCLYRNCMEEEKVLEILELMEPYPVSLEGFVDGVPYASREYVENPAAFGAPPGSFPYIRRTRRPVEHIREFIRENRTRVDAIDILAADVEFKREIEARLAALGGLYVTSSVPHLVEIGNKTAGKASALAWLSEFLGISREEILACGNADNDRDMILYAGVGAAVDNSSDSLKAAADVVTADNDHDGVAVVIEKMVLRGEFDGKRSKDQCNAFIGKE